MAEYLRRLWPGRAAAAKAADNDAMAPIRELYEKQLVYVAYQPVVDLKTHQIYSYEALARSKSPHYNTGPLEILRDAVTSGLVGQLGRLLRKLSVEGCPGFPLFINLHPNEFNEGWLVRPDDPIFEHDDEVYLEITEAVPLSHFQYCNSVLREVRGKGIKLAIDDLGAGFSNLKYIADLTPEIVKIDRELVAGLDSVKRQRRLVKSIVTLCQDMGAKVVAEGVETMGELDAVIDTGCDFAQGYLLARPAFPPPPAPWPVF